MIKANVAAGLGLATLGVAAAWAAEPSGAVAPSAVQIDEAGRIEAPLTAEAGNGYRGVQLFIEDRVGCTACHYNADVEGTGKSGTVGPVLSLIGDQNDPARLRAILVNAPAVLGEEVEMPAYFVADDEGETLLGAQEIEDLVAYLSELHLVPR